MALPTDNSFEATCTSTPAYVVYRDISKGEPSDPSSPLLFFPPKGSDELFDALRTAFPHLKTHSERMRDAMIQFLLEERQEELLRTCPALTMDGTAPTTTTTTWLSASASSSSSSASASASASAFSSPDLLDFPSPSSLATSPRQTLPPQQTRTASIAASSQASRPSSLDQMTGVFSLSAESLPKQHMRRKMTEAEKVEYRKRRIVKACDKCAKRKRKCPHNQAQMEIVPASSKSSGARVSRRKSSPKSNFDVDKNRRQQNCAVVEPVVMAAEDWDFTAGLDMSTCTTFQSGEDDFPTMFGDPFADFTVDDFVQWDQPATNFQPPLDHQFTSNLLPFSLSDPSSGGHVANTVVQPVPGATGDVQQNVHPGSQAIPQPTHTAHVHNAGCGEFSGFTEANQVLKQPRLEETLGQATLKLVGTTKAVRTCAGLDRPDDCTSASQPPPISRRRATDALSHTTEPPQSPCRECTRLSSPRASERREGQFETSSSSAAAAKHQRRLPTTLAEGALQLANMSTELYMLRRRIPHKPATSQNHQHVTNSNAETCQLAAHAPIGGAHVRLQSEEAFHAARSTTTIAITTTTTYHCISAQAHVTFTSALVEKSSARNHMFCQEKNSHGRLPRLDTLHNYPRIENLHAAGSFAVMVMMLVLGLFAITLFVAALFTLCYSFLSFFSVVLVVAAVAVLVVAVVVAIAANKKHQPLQSSKSKNKITSSYWLSRLSRLALALLMRPSLAVSTSVSSFWCHH